MLNYIEKAYKSYKDYARKHSLPATKLQVRRALARNFKKYGLKASNVVQKRNEDGTYALLLSLPTSKQPPETEERHLVRLLNLYLAFNNYDVKRTYELLWSLG